MDELMRMPEMVKKINEFVVTFETKSLRDTKDTLEKVNIQEAAAYVEQNPHPRLWKLLAEKALDKLDLRIAEKAFVKSENLYGIRFIKKLQVVDDDKKKKAEIAAFYGKYDDAEEIYAMISRKDLGLDLRKKIGDYKKVIALLGESGKSDIDAKEANKKMGDFYADKGKWTKAAPYYSTAQDYPMLIESYYRAENYESLQKLIGIIPEDPVLLENLAAKFNSVGMCECAVEVYLKMGEVKKAIDSCILLNDWNRVFLSEKSTL